MLLEATLRSGCRDARRLSSASTPSTARAGSASTMSTSVDDGDALPGGSHVEGGSATEKTMHRRHSRRRALESLTAFATRREGARGGRTNARRAPRFEARDARVASDVSREVPRVRVVFPDHNAARSSTRPALTVAVPSLAFSAAHRICRRDAKSPRRAVARGPAHRPGNASVPVRYRRAHDIGGVRGVRAATRPPSPGVACISAPDRVAETRNCARSGAQMDKTRPLSGGFSDFPYEDADLAFV